MTLAGGYTWYTLAFKEFLWGWGECPRRGKMIIKISIKQGVIIQQSMILSQTKLMTFVGKEVDEMKY